MGAIRTITREKLAKEWGISPNVIDNMLQKRQLRKIAHGLIDYDHALTVRAGQSPAARERAIVAKAAKGETASPPTAAQGEAPVSPPPSRDDHPATGTAEAMLKARAAKTIADAKIAALNHERLKGSLVPVDEVKRDAANAGRVLVARLNTLPARLGPMLASISDPTECIKAIEKEVGHITRELREALAGL